MTIFLVMTQQLGSAGRHNIAAAFIDPMRAYLWISNTQKPELYFIKPQKVIDDGPQGS